MQEEVRKKVKEQFEDCLIDFFIDGFASGLLMIDEKKALKDPYAFLDIEYSDGETVLEKFEKNYEKGNIYATFMSEANRMFNTGILEAVEGTKGTKTWTAILDEVTRETHWGLDGMTVGIDEEFVTYKGDSAPAPMMFGIPDEDVNCRCSIWIDRA